MADLLFLAIIVVFFALAVLFVRACDRILGPEEAAVAPAGEETERMAA